MDLLKKHYEKILLGLVLLGLFGGVAFMIIKINGDKQKLEEMANTYINPKITPLTNLDLTLAENTLKRAGVPAMLDLSSSNKLFNPMPWLKQQTDGRLIRSDKAGP